MKKTKIAIYLDFKNANLITLEGKESAVTTLASAINTSKPKGGSRGKLRYGATDTISEKHYLERRKQQEKAYYEKIMEAVKNAEEVLLFGPAEAKEGLLKAVKANTTFKPVLKGYEVVDSRLTLNQKVAFARDFFADK